MSELKALAESGVFSPIVDRVFPFEHIVDAHAFADSDQKRGNIVVALTNDQRPTTNDQ